MYLLLLFLPLLSSIVAGLLGRRIGERGAGIYTSVSIVLTFILSVFILYEIGLGGSPTYITL